MKIRNLFFIAYQNLILDYKHSKLSLLWIPITFSILIFAKVFFLGDILGRDEKFLVYLTIGVWIWQFISMSVISYGSSLYDNQTLLNIKINPFNFIYINFLKLLIIFFMHSFVLLIFLFFNEIKINFIYLFIPIFFLLIGMYEFGKLLSIVSFFSRDLTIFINSFLIVIFFLSPIFWYPDDLPENKKILLSFNPIYHLLNLFRDSILLSKINFFSLKILLSIYFFIFFLNKIFVNKIIKNVSNRI